MGPQKQRADSGVTLADHKLKDVQSINDTTVFARKARVPLKKQLQSQKTRKAQQQRWLLANPLGTLFTSPGVIKSTTTRVSSAPTGSIPSPIPINALEIPESKVESMIRPLLPVVKSLYQSKDTVLVYTASQPSSSGACPLLDRLPYELHHLIFSYLFDGAIVLDKGWLLDDYRANKGMNPRHLPVFYRASKPAFHGQSTARIEPVISRANTSIMFTCKRLLEVYAPQVYGRSAFAISRTQTARNWLLPWNSGSSSLRKLNSPCPWITTLHIHVPVYGAPRFRSDIKYQARHYLSWRTTMASIAQNCISLKEVHLSVDVPRKLPLRVDLRQDWAWALLPLASCKPLNICIVELNMDWHSDMIGAFEEYLTTILKGGDRSDAVAALESARTEAFCTEEGLSLIDEWDEFVMWNEQERRLFEAAAEWQLIVPSQPRSPPRYLPRQPTKKI